MLSLYRIRSALFAATCVVGCAAPAFADSVAPHPIQQGDVSYITGGIGLTERHALEAARRDYNLQVTNSENNGHFTAGANLVIQDGSGQEVLRVNDAGPLLYVKLPAGQYTVHAIFEGVEREKSAKIGDKGTTTINLVWPTED